MYPSNPRIHPGLAALAATLLVLGACAPAHEAAGPAAPAPARADLAWAADTDPAEAAARIQRACVRDRSAEACRERALLGLLEAAGVATAMETLEEIARTDARVQREGHVYAHAIGIAAYRSPETAAEAFASCTPAFQSGCYHGVIQAYFADPRVTSGGVDAAAINALCGPYEAAGEAWLAFQCTHGMGHGLMAVHRHNLLHALDACDLLESLAAREGCYGGAFMENVVNATQPHHTGTHHAADHAAAVAGDGHESHAGHGDHVGHAHDGMDHGEPFKALDDDDPLYPCTIVADRHRVQCYLMQTSAILFRNDGDFAAAAGVCAAAPEEMRGVCFMSLGRDAASWSDQDHAKAIAMCDHAPQGHRGACYAGTAKNLVDRTADPADGFAFCRALRDPAGKSACYRGIGGTLVLLEPTAEERGRRCAEAEPAFVATCREAAGAPAAGRE